MLCTCDWHILCGVWYLEKYKLLTSVSVFPSSVLLKLQQVVTFIIDSSVDYNCCQSMCHLAKKYPSQFSRAQGNNFELPALCEYQSKTQRYKIYNYLKKKNREKQQLLIFEKLYPAIIWHFSRLTPWMISALNSATCGQQTNMLITHLLKFLWHICLLTAFSIRPTVTKWHLH